MVAIIILNWNGYKDTIECLKSLYKMDYNDFFIIVGDNGSTDDSLLNIKNWSEHNGISYKTYQIGDAKPEQISNRDLIIYEMKNNHGFSKGNNLMIKFISSINPDYYFLLNNDTEVEPDMMDKLIDFASSNSEFKALTPQIRYYYDKTKIWNCGGNITWGTRKYHYVNQSYKDIKEQLYIPCSFVTGCALLFKKDILNEEGNLFTEKFFFGEEDFELGLRMKQAGNKMACVVTSIIYHKVGTSTKSAKALKRSFIYYMNRFIDMRDYMNRFEYVLWKTLYIPYIFRAIYQESDSVSETFKFIKQLLSEVRKNKGVSQVYFQEIWNTNNII